MSDISDLINRLGEASMEARELVRECHEATRDLRDVLREYRAVKNEVRHFVSDAAKMEFERVQEMIIKKVDELTKRVSDLIYTETDRAMRTAIETTKAKYMNLTD